MLCSSMAHLSGEKCPKLHHIIIQWLKSELPLAKVEEYEDRILVTVNRKTGKTVSPVFSLSINASEMSVKSGFMEDTFLINEDSVEGGKWTKYEKIMAADPEFFIKLTVMLTQTAMVVTMGAFCPDVPEKPKSLSSKMVAALKKWWSRWIPVKRV
jgi:hypothetical protein